MYNTMHATGKVRASAGPAELSNVCEALRDRGVRVWLARYGWRECRIVVEGVDSLAALLLDCENDLPSYPEVRFDYLRWANYGRPTVDGDSFPVVLMLPTRDLVEYREAFSRR